MIMVAGMHRLFGFALVGMGVEVDVAVAMAVRMEVNPVADQAAQNFQAQADQQDDECNRDQVQGAERSRGKAGCQHQADHQRGKSQPRASCRPQPDTEYRRDERQRQESDPLLVKLEVVVYNQAVCRDRGLL